MRWHEGLAPQQKKLVACYKKLRLEYGRDPRGTELAEALKISKQRIDIAMRALVTLGYFTVVEIPGPWRLTRKGKAE